MTDKQFPPLPVSECWAIGGIHGLGKEWYTADQMKAYVEADRASAPAQPVGRSALSGEYALLMRWGERALDAHPADAMLIKRHARELLEVLAAAQGITATQKESS
ncbi:hypothetical protein SAMN05216344_10686 [Polaromonas sp. OV174]|uniref:hypothetical protein n=1 Tax=Polaromonas sp. OV174 TaxID=1855300 RepID=UPI0008ECE215|nr:hypothetical protein [Polaromonas sp. OV174]SFB95805.1 hypothetical protein SAMN05216344_10686 [Polaromonas sp. OV174]